MSNTASAGTTCPTCFEGRCPQINTTPDVPEPDEIQINAAMRVIPDILAENFKTDSRFEGVASQLLEYLLRLEYGSHRTPAAKWAVHRLIQRNMLTVHEWVQIGLEAPSEHPKLRFCRETRMFKFEQPPKPPRTARIYRVGPVAYGEFMVRAEMSLWEWWRAPNGGNKDIPPGHHQIYRMEQLCAELKVTPTTVRKYAKRIGFPFDGKRNHQFTSEQRLAIYQQVADNAPITLAKIARERLEMERNKNGNGNFTESRKSQETL